MTTVWETMLLLTLKRKDFVPVDPGDPETYGAGCGSSDPEHSIVQNFF
jgi:hypothetical protein